ncbi:hypothetical protein WJX72_000447 [[Myrmecia] bisecta]|uniref:CCHC-type domain-containing protein n=1 Tax=[Myrmecia] bisecta TaxID=41462 RepID=A0AAW1PGS0_9CHLO
MRAVGTAQRSQEAGYGQACQVLAGVVRVFGTSQQRQPLLPGRTFLLQHKVVGVGCEHRQRDLLRTLAGKTNRASLSVPRGQPLTQSRGPDGRMIVCPQCGGRGVVRTPAGLQLCPGCQEWRRQNLLVDPSALDFSALDAMVDSAPPATKRKAKSARQPLTAEHREKIRSALKGRSMGERSVEHRRNIAESMKRLMANNDTHRARISQAMTGKPKICSHCGEEGHNKRTCPQLNPDRAAQVEPPERFVVPVPVRAEEAVLQASGAILRAWQRGLRRLKVDFLLPPGPNARQPLLDQNGWPGGIRQQFRSAQPMVEGALRQLKQVPGLQGRLSADWLDETDCVGAWESETLAAVLFPTADSLHQLRELEGDRGGKRLVLIVNPQWQTAGQIVSDFGFGRSAKESETYVKSFQDVYCLKRVRFMGDEVRLLKCYPGDWQVHYIRPNGRVVLAGIEKEAPSYSRLEELLRTVPGTQAGRTWVERIIKPTKFGTGSGANALSAEAAAASAAPDDAASKPRSSPAALYAPTGAGDFGYRPDEADQLAAKKPLSSKRTSIRAAKAAASQPALDALASAASVAAQLRGAVVHRLVRLRSAPQMMWRYGVAVEAQQARMQAGVPKQTRVPMGG